MARSNLQYTVYPPGTRFRVMVRALVIVMMLLLSGEGVSCMPIDSRCNLMALFPFSDDIPFTFRGGLQNISLSNISPYESVFARWSPDTIGQLGWGYIAAAELAMQHWNKRDPSVVPQLADDYLRDCNLTMGTIDYFNTGLSNLRSVRVLLRETQCVAELPCAIVGPSRDELAPERTMDLAGALDIPNVHYYGDHPRGFDSDSKTHSVGLVPSISYRARAMCDWVATGLGRKHLVLLVQGGPSGEIYPGAVVPACKELGVRVEVVHFPAPPPGVAREEYNDGIMNRVVNTGIKTILMGYDRPAILLSKVIDLERNGLLGDDYVYIIPDDALQPRFLPTIVGRQPSDSAVRKFLHGLAIVGRIDGYDHRGTDNDGFLNAWHNLDASFVQRVNALSPMNATTDVEHFAAPDDYFIHNLPPPMASYVYDSVMSVAIGYCTGQQQSRIPGVSVGPSGDNDGVRRLQAGADMRPPPRINSKVKNEHVRGMLQSNFTGASGSIEFDLARKMRKPDGVQYGVFNAIGKENGDGTTSFTVELADVIGGSDGKVKKEKDFKFRNNKNTPTDISIQIANENFLDQWVRVIGLTLMSLNLFQAVTCIILVWLYRKERTVRAGQPFFLWLLCVGSIIVSCAIFTLSFDEGRGWTADQLGIACMSTLWLFFVGYVIIYSALFSKMWRIDKVLQFQRARKVEVYHVLGPLVILLLTTIAILTTWTVRAPFEWEREYVSQVPPETHGECEGDHFAAFFSSLCAIMVAATVLTVYLIWRTKDIPQDFSDTSSIFYAISAQMQAWFVGLPIIIVLDSASGNASYLAKVMLIFIMAFSPVALVIVPKVVRLTMSGLGIEFQERGARVTVAGVEKASRKKSSVFRDSGGNSRYTSSTNTQANESTGCHDSISGGVRGKDTGGE